MNDRSHFNALSALEGGGPGQVPTHWKGLQLSHFQRQAVEAILAGENVLLSAPTGAGKTLVAEVAIADAVARGRRAVFTAPIKALSNQKYRDFQADPAIDVGLLTGDVTIHPEAQVLIMTTEILRNAIFEDPTQLDGVDYVIFDEVHYMDDPERGSVWEESIIFAPPTVRFVALSATIPNLDQLGAWIREVRDQPLRVINTDKRPVPLKHRLHHADYGVFDLGKLGYVQKQLGEARDKRKRDKPKRDSRGRRGPPQERGRGVVKLLDHAETDGLLPALVFSFSRKDCERLARKNRHRRLLDEQETLRMRNLQLDLLKRFQLDERELAGEVFQLTAVGVGYHHAGMLPIHKEVVERLFTSGLLKLLFTTETFALGINMPARTAIFGGLKKFDGISFDYMRTRDYLQMAGRAGRQGIDERGHVFVNLEDEDVRDAPLTRLLEGKPEAVESRFRLSYSTILHLYEALGSERLFEAWQKSFNQYQHRSKSKKARERNRAEQRRWVDAHLGLLSELGYIGPETSDGRGTLEAKGKIARYLVGYELQLTELLFRGAFENLPPAALAMIAVALIFEERGRGGPTYVSPRLFGGVRRHVDQVLGKLANDEIRFGVPTSIKRCDWGMTPAVIAWCEGAEMDHLEENLDIVPGDAVRTFRMAVQLLRHLRRVVDERDTLYGTLEAARHAMNRDVVDARRQLQLG
ncbi:MAG: DEAD/DEAH box helicase [Planctomycetota bacterium]